MLVAAGLSSLAGSRADAAALLLDFGPTAVTNTSPDFDATVSPGQQDGGITGGSTWNQVQLTDIGSGLVFNNGTATTGVSVNLGKNTDSAATTTVDLLTQPTSNSALGTTNNTNIYSGTRVAKDGIFGTSGGALGLRVDGLAAGDYAVYLTGRNTNSGTYGPTASAMDFFVSTGAAVDTFNYSSWTKATASNPNTGTGVLAGNAVGNPTSFTEGSEYVKFVVSLSQGQSLFLASDGAAVSGETRGFLNSIEITAVPEPGAFMLMGLGALGALRRRR
ncbi:MAG TPA: PEP-CTERM sorting domain-containing protein [Tepidisphaeraceae bacterium]|nr:PEP-CTERM sorting domain-containing protein [Tepidisphaeraceae bacterium]